MISRRHVLLGSAALGSGALGVAAPEPPPIGAIIPERMASGLSSMMLLPDNLDFSEERMGHPIQREGETDGEFRDRVFAFARTFHPPDLVERARLLRKPVVVRPTRGVVEEPSVCFAGFGRDTSRLS